MKVRFRVRHADQDLFIDYKGTELLELRLNGVTIAPQWNKLFITIPKASLKVFEANDLSIRFRNKYQTDGTGLHSFNDTDGKQYVYSQGESYFCNRL